MLYELKMDLINTLNFVTQNLFSPSIMFFILGFISGFIKSGLSIPESISKFLSIYLMIAIGLKGGVTLASCDELSMSIVFAILSGVIFGFLQPFISNFIIRKITKIDSFTSAAISAQYGSVSIVTFITASNFLEINSIPYSGTIIVALALMEVPAIISGLYIAFNHNVDSNKKNLKLRREFLINSPIVLLIGSFLIGLFIGEEGSIKVQGLFVSPFNGMLCLFLLEMGINVSKHIDHLKKISINLLLFAIYMPIIGAFIGLFISICMGLDVGTSTLFVILFASASYIAVPVAMKLALPEAKSAIYLTMSLAITFPFNVIFGIPLYFTTLNMIL